MTRTQTAVAALCVLSLLIAIVALFLAPSRGATAYWCLAILWSAGWLIDLLRARRRAHRPRQPSPRPGPGLSAERGGKP